MKALAALLKPDYAERMKIQRCPWLESDEMEFGDVYKPVEIAKKTGLPYETGTTFVYDYQNVFTEDEGYGEGGGKRPKRTRKKVILQGSPGMGKSTMVSKMVYDWATDVWTTFTVVFLISLKLVRPGQAIENIIVDEDVNPVLYDEEYDPELIRSILKIHGEKCLLIFDGLDELRHNDNDEVIKIIQDKKYRSCNILLTSRPHTVDPYMKKFFTQATLRGFNEEVAKSHIKDMLREKEKVHAVFEFAQENQRIGFYEMWQNPMLLLFICILVNDDNLDLTNKYLTLDEIYENLHLCLYKRYTTRKGIVFDVDQWNQIMIKLGKMARRGLERGELLYKISDIENEVGKEAFNFGIIVGYRDRRIIRDLSADLWVCFLHRSIQEFLAAKYIHNELNASDRRPEDLWPEVWCQYKITLIPLLFVFLVEMVKENSPALQKLLTSCVNIFNNKFVSFFGNLIGRRVMEFLSKAIAVCHSIEHLQFQGGILQDDENLIPQLVSLMGPVFVSITFLDCRFVKGTVGSIEPFTRDKGITFVCEQSTIPADSLSFLIARCRCVQKLHVGAYHISGSEDEKEVKLYYEALVNLFSRPLPTLKNVTLEAQKGDVYQNSSKHSSIIKNFMNGCSFTGNIPDIEILDLRFDSMPTNLKRIILGATTEEPARTNLKVLNICCLMSNHLPMHCDFFSRLFFKPFPNLQMLIWNDRTQDEIDDKCKNDRMLIERYKEDQESMMAEFAAENDVYMTRLPQHSVKGYFPKIERVDFSVNIYMPRRATEILMEALDGSTTLTGFKLNTILLPQFMVILQGDGLPNLEVLEIRHVFTTDPGPVPQEQQKYVCLLPKLREFDLKWLVGKEQLHSNLLKQLMISLRGSIFLTRLNISGQDVGGCFRFLLHKEGLPGLLEFKADRCNLNQTDLLWIGVAAQAGKLKKVRFLSLAYNPDIVQCVKHLCKDWESLQEISLAGVLMNADDVYHLMKACRVRMPQLQVIYCDSYCRSYWAEHQEEKARKMLRVEYVSEHAKQLSDMFLMLKAQYQQMQ